MDTSKLLILALMAVMWQKSTAEFKCRLDLGVIIDESGSIKASGFKQETKFISDLAKQLPISPEDTRIGVISFSSFARVRLRLNERAATNRALLDKALQKMTSYGGKTYTEKAIDLARTDLFSTSNGARQGVSKVLLILTDGRSHSGLPRVRAAADKLKKMGINVISIGVGRVIVQKELEAMVSHPVAEHVFRVSSAAHLRNIVNKVRTESCKEIYCRYKECIYTPWGAWDRTCGPTSRHRRLISSNDNAKYQTGGCAGLPTTCDNDDVETKYLEICPIFERTTQPPRTTLATKQVVTKTTLNFFPTEPTQKESVKNACHIRYHALGCFKDQLELHRPLPELILTERDRHHPSWNGHLIHFDQWDSYVVEFACKCAAETRRRNYRFFSVQFYGECWSGPEAGSTYNKDGLQELEMCAKQKFEPCAGGDEYCIGKAFTNYVYQIE